VDNGVDLAGRDCYLGLPNYNMSNFSNSLQTVFASSDTSVCEKFCIDFFDSTLNGPVSWQWYFPGGSPSSSTDQNPTHICYDDPGVYDVSLVTTNSGGAADSVTYVNYITVNSNPFAPVITQTWNILTSSAASSYQWYLNGDIIPGATDQSYEITEDGLYTVYVMNETGCESQSSFNAVLSGVEDLNANFSAAIYPNPSNGNFVFELMGIENIGDVYLDVVNAIGQKVFSWDETISTSHWKKEIDLTKVSTGTYLIEIKMQDQFITKKILID
jgi:PKD repeat protein